MPSNIISPLGLLTFNVAVLNAINYQLITSATGLDEACFYLRFINNSNVDVTVSFDGTFDHEYLIAQSQIPINGQTNASPTNYVCQFKKGQLIYVKGTPGVGTFNIVGYHNN